MACPGKATASRGRLRPGRVQAALALLPALALLLACATAPKLPEPRWSDHLVFWEVRPEASPGRAWLLGSVHMAREDPEFDPAVDRAFEASDALVLEVDPAVAEDPLAMARLFVELALLEEGLTLADVLSEEGYARLEAAFEEQGHELFALERMKPWMIMLMWVNERMAAAGYAPEKGVDFHFQERAADRLPILALESAEEQLGSLDGMPYPLQERLLLEALDDEGEHTDLLFAAWHAGDLELLEALVLPDLEGDPELEVAYEAVFFQRNRVMAERLTGLLADGGAYFVVVGAGHMVGPQGIPALLEEGGFDVRRVPRTP
jgi:uncharacterized protein